MSMHSAAVREDSQEREHGGHLRFGPETEKLLAAMRKVTNASDGGPFGAPSEPVYMREA